MNRIMSLSYTIARWQHGVCLVRFVCPELPLLEREMLAEQLERSHEVQGLAPWLRWRFPGASLEECQNVLWLARQELVGLGLITDI
jgi:hypothetical protein